MSDTSSKPKKKGFWKTVWQWLTQDVLGLARPTTTSLSPQAYAKAVLKQSEEAIKARRDVAKKFDPTLDSVPPGSMGIAYSGGGIRSATISLGLTQALTRRGRLLDFDYCSTVSGGGYFGSFLGSLFLPESSRGTQAAVGGERAELEGKARFALDALRGKSSETEMQVGQPGPNQFSIRHPVRWLRGARDRLSRDHEPHAP
jgi:hypothetical protein